jgi:His-Xaa-Ser system protein HxsD
MINQTNDRSATQEVSTSLTIDHDLISTEALLKTCYWFSRDFICDVIRDSQGQSTVHLRPKHTCSVSLADAREQFMTQAFDFALREQVAAKTSDVRDLLLAKAFSESGVLEDQPHGVFGDALEESKPDGMFKILGNG